MLATFGTRDAAGTVRPRDRALARALAAAGVDFAAEIPCAIVGGVGRALAASGVPVLDVTREEEGVGICAGAALAGRTPAILLQNSGIGNSANALASLIEYYRLPLVLVVGARGGPTDTIAAQRPMGRAFPRLLVALRIPGVTVRTVVDVRAVTGAVRRARREGRAVAIVVRPEEEA